MSTVLPRKGWEDSRGADGLRFLFKRANGGIGEEGSEWKLTARMLAFLVMASMHPIYGSPTMLNKNILLSNLHPVKEHCCPHCKKMEK
jgi:hypothetical protein